MSKARELNNPTLDGAIADYARIFQQPTTWAPPESKWPDPSFEEALGPRVARNGEDWVVQSLWKARFGDEFNRLVEGIEHELGPQAQAKFRKRAGEIFTPRSSDTLEQELAERRAERPDGTHIKGTKGREQIGTRIIGYKPWLQLTHAFQKRLRAHMRGIYRVDPDLGVFLRSPDQIAEIMAALPQPEEDDYEAKARKIVWPIYRYEDEERAAGSDCVDELPSGHREMTMAVAMRISAEAAIAMCDALVDRLDEGSTDATLRLRTGTQPADPDATESGTLLGTLTYSSTAFGAAADQSPHARATAASVSDDSSADATDTVTYCRAGATGSGADDHIDGSAGTSSVDFAFNTDAIVSGATISMTSHTIDVKQYA